MPAVRTLLSTKKASLRVHCLQPGPSSHERSGDVQREATSASLPIAALVACRAEEGTPLPIGLPAMKRLKLSMCERPWRSETLSAPALSTAASTSKGLRLSMVAPRP